MFENEFFKNPIHPSLGCFAHLRLAFIFSARICNPIFNGVKWFLCPDPRSKFLYLWFKKSDNGISIMDESSFGDPLVLGDSKSTSENAHTGSDPSKGKQYHP